MVCGGRGGRTHGWEAQQTHGGRQIHNENKINFFLTFIEAGTKGVHNFLK
jgi:hypothetical protein